MKRRCSLLVLADALLSPRLGAAEGEFVARSWDQPRLPPTVNRAYRLYVPAQVARPLPLVIYLHGAGAKGEDNAKPAREPLARYLAAREQQERFPAYVLVPQCRAGEDAGGRPNNWVKWRNQRESPPAQWDQSDAEPSDQLRGAQAAVEDVLRREQVDRSRIVLTGVSMGGSGSWYWSAIEPERFAAVMPVCGLSEPRRAERLKHLPVWTFQGDQDDTVPVARTRAMVAALREVGAPVKYSEFAGVGHGVESSVRTTPGWLEWLFAQKRKA